MSSRCIEEIVRKRKLITATRTTTVREAARTMADERVGAVVVLESGRLVGIFTERDIAFRVVARGLDPDKTQLAKVMTTHPVTIGAEKPLGHALHLMYEGGFRHVPVLAHGKPIGVVSSRDALGRELVDFEGELKQRDNMMENLR
jgi:CBS domain-containing protein